MSAWSGQCPTRRAPPARDCDSAGPGKMTRMRGSRDPSLGTQLMQNFGAALLGSSEGREDSNRLASVEVTTRHLINKTTEERSYSSSTLDSKISGTLVHNVAWHERR